MGRRKLWRIPEAAVFPVVGLLVKQYGRIQQSSVCRPGFSAALLQRRNNSVRLAQQGRPVCLPLFVDDEQQLPQAGSAAPAAFREVRPREKGLLLRRHKNAGGPAAAAGKCLADGHIDAVNIRPFLPVHLDGHKITVQDLRDLRILKALMGHHMAPVAGTVSDAQENRLVLFPCPPERRLAPGIPVHRIFGVLEQIGTGLML